MESAGPTTTLILRTCESDPRVRAVDGSRTIEIFYAVVLNVFLCVCVRVISHNSLFTYQETDVFKIEYNQRRFSVKNSDT